MTSFVYGLIAVGNVNLVRAKNRILLLQSQYAAESGADTAIAFLNSGNLGYTGTTSDIQVLNSATYRSTYSVTVSPGTDDKERIIQAEGKVYSPKGASQPTHTRKIQVTARRTTDTTADSMMSRNIIYIESGVKNIRAKDIYVNGYIQMDKNTTNMIAEKIFVADKNTGANNCSIGGVGNLVKPSSFSDPAQTRTRIVLAYNNCISPPGNASNANFEVSVNQPNIPKIQASNIPFNYVMDGTYQASPTGCNDWTAGTSPRNIPSTGNEKRTHYPDTGSNISTSCGTSGDLSLGSAQYNIRDHVHVRANLCAASACTPIFNNPTAQTKFIFVEGTINFNSMQTASGSGPIVFIVYGTDPPSKTSVCPLGGSVYLGNSGNTIAPKVYFNASNGICLNKTRFGADPALGGVSGKNVFISTNPGSPFDLRLDPVFPVQDIPIDLSWRATRYIRL